MRYSLRTLLIAVAVTGCVLAYWRCYLDTQIDSFEMLGVGFFRVYDTAWQALLFTPAAKLESALRGHPVYAARIKEKR